MFNWIFGKKKLTKTQGKDITIEIRKTFEVETITTGKIGIRKEITDISQIEITGNQNQTIGIPIEEGEILVVKMIGRMKEIIILKKRSPQPE